MGLYHLLDQPNTAGTGAHYYKTRNGPGIKAIVLHGTAGRDDRDMLGIDTSVDGELRYLTVRKDWVSFHSVSDSDSHRRVIPDSYTGAHCKGYNSTTIGHEFCRREMDWRNDPSRWVEAVLRQGAESLRDRARALGIPLRQAKKWELDQAIAKDGPPVGFIQHGTLDPDRRTDVGQVKLSDGSRIDTFPWKRFFELMGAPNFILGGWPLPDDHWFGEPSSDPRNHSGYWERDQEGVRDIQEGFARRGWSNVKVTGRFSAEDGDRVNAFRVRVMKTSPGRRVTKDVYRAIDKLPAT